MVPRVAASRSSSGSRTEASTTRWWRVSDGQHREQPLLDRGRLQRRQQDDERPLPAELGHRPGQRRPVRLRDDRLEVGHRVLEIGRDVAGAGRAEPGADPPVAGHEVDPVAGPRGQGGQEQRGVHGGVEPGHVLDPAGRGARGVEHQHHPAVALGLPGADHDVAVARAGAPVDRADVVAADVLTQRVELGALAADPDRGPSVELAEPGQPAGQVLAGLERRQRADRPRHAEGLLAPGQPERTAQPGGHTQGAQVAAAARCQPGPQQHAVTRREGDPVPVSDRARGGLPGVAHDPAHRPAADVLHQQHRLRVVAHPDRPHRLAGHREALDRGRQHQVGDEQQGDDEQPQPHGARLGPEHHGHHSEEEQQREPAGDSHSRPRLRHDARPRRATLTQVRR